MIIDVLTGQVQSGKTTLLQKITLELKGKHIGVGGFLSLSVHEAGRVIGYDLFDLSKETKRPFLRRQGRENWEKIGPYFFIPEALEQAKNIILHANKIEVCFIDEVGPMELEGRGLWPAIEGTITHPIPRLFVTVRETLLDAVLAKLEQHVDRIFNVAEHNVHLQIIDHLEQNILGK